jgi:hypothetical protein
MRKVMIVVLVLMMSCQVSLNPKSGPDNSHKTIIPPAIENAAGRPAIDEHHCANRLKVEDFLTINKEGTPLTSLPRPEVVVGCVTNVRVVSRHFGLLATASPEGHP